MANPMQYRGLRFYEKPDVESRTFTIPVSSELPVQRWWGTEILDHSPEAIDLSRLQDGAPVLLDHDPTRQIGVVEHAQAGADRRLMSTIRFSRATLGEEVLQDVNDGIRRNVSIGYGIDEVVAAGEDTYIVKRWTPYEISLTSIPADNQVGFGRSAVDESYNPLTLLRGSPMDTETPVVEEAVETPAEEPVVDTTDIVRKAIAEERRRISGIRESVRMAKLSDDIAEKLIDSGKPLDECRSEVIRMWSERVDNSATDSGATEPEGSTQTRTAEYAAELLKQVAGVK